MSAVAAVPAAASRAYSRNVTSLLRHLLRDGPHGGPVVAVDLTDEIQAGVVLAHDGLVRVEGGPS